MSPRRTRTPNNKAIYELAAAIASSTYGFNMASYAGSIHDAKPELENVCGTAGCIAGHGAAIWQHTRTTTSQFKNLLDKEYYYADPLRVAKELGLTQELASQLFIPNTKAASFRAPAGHRLHINRCMAVGALQRLATTGEVRFDRADADGVQLLPEVEALLPKFQPKPKDTTKS